MKLAAADARTYLKRPEGRFGAVLLYGPDPIRVAENRANLVERLIGPDGAREFRLTSFPAADARKRGGEILDCLKAVGFFPGPRAVVLDDATDAQRDLLERALSTLAEGDAVLVVTAGSLPARSRMRALFEAAGNAAAIGIYDDPPDKGEVDEMIAAAGLGNMSPDGAGQLHAFAGNQTPPEFRQTLEKLALYTMRQQNPVGPEDIAAVVPELQEAGVDDVLWAAAEGRPDDVAPLIYRLYAQGYAPAAISVRASRYFRMLHAASLDPRNAESVLSRMRPPVFGKRRKRMAEQARRLGCARLEALLGELLDVELALRSSDPSPDRIAVERVLLRLAMTAGRVRSRARQPAAAGARN